MNYANGQIPDYTRSEVRQLYLLRYLPAYLVEYYIMYNGLINCGFLGLPMSVISVGVGCGVDFYALHHVLSDRRIWRHGLVNYTGIDRVDWGYVYNFGHPGFALHHGDILHLEEFARADTNVLVFPKSIGEFSEQAFRHVLHLIQASRFNSPHLAVLSSLRVSSSRLDEQRTAAVVNALSRAHGYEVYRNTGVVRHESMGISKLNRNFCYPDELKHFVTSLADSCRARGRDENCISCSEQLNRSPILRTDHMSYQVICLQK